MDLNFIWFLLVGVLFIGYAILDGFDLGVGIFHLFTKTDYERRISLNAIGPVWDGNEVWLVTGGGALFAAFPHAYATVFSGFYTAFMLFLCGLIFRAVAIEFRSKQPGTLWRNGWDASFSISSILSTLLMGVALGNIARGVPLGADFEYAGSFWTLLNPYAVVIGLTTIALYAMHGAIYLVMKTEDELHDKLRVWAKKAIFVFIAFYILSTVLTFLMVPRMLDNFKHYPLLMVFPILNALAIANIFREFNRGKDGRAFISSCFSIVCLLAIFGIGIFPNLVWSAPNPEYSLSIYNAASSPQTLTNMLIIAIIGMPLVLAYTISIYYIFRGKVVLDASSY